MKFGYTILYVDDVEATLSFYGKAFGLKQKMLHKTEDGNAYGELDTGETTLSFAARRFVGSHISIPVQKGGLGNDPPAVEVALVGEDVQAAFDKAIAAGATPVQNPSKKPWGQVVGYVTRQQRISGRTLFPCWMNSARQGLPGGAVKSA